MRARESKRRWWLLCLAVVWGGIAVAQTGNLAKIDPELQEQMHQSRDASETFRVIVEMAEQYDNPNLERGTAMMTRAQRRDYVVGELKRFSEGSQAEVVGFLTNQSTRGQVNVLHRFWIFNGLCCEATAECIEALSMRYDIRFVLLDTEIELDEPERTEGTCNNLSTEVEWHVSKVRANKVWNELGYTGAGIVVAILDTGVNYNHPDLSANMWDGGELYPNHGWDFYDDDNDPMDINEDPNAIDPNIAHGSMVTGVVVGSGGIGIAPNAAIMALRINSMDDILSAIEFALEHGADVLNLSRGMPGVGGMASFRDSFVNVMNAGITAAVAAGNYGEPDSLAKYPIPYNICSPGNCPPPWHNPNQLSFSTGGSSAVICVGNTTQDDLRNPSSSIGPVTWAMGEFIGSYNDYLYFPESPTSISGLIRPDVSAPGTDIYSLRYDESLYYIASGTSMASPCVAGIIALMLEANPNLTPTQIDEILETTAVACDGQTYKNNEYGAGRVDAYAAVTAVRNMKTITTNAFPTIGGTIAGGGSYLEGEQCMLIATPNLGYAFAGWYNGAILVSMSPSYTFTVNGNRTLTAMFAQRDYTITVNASPLAGGTVSGGGTYPAGSTVTLTATANAGYVFNGWMENGVRVCNSPTYTFQALADRHLAASFVSTEFTIGSLVTNPDGSQGVVFYLEPSGTEGWMVALNDASEGCSWGEATNVLALQEVPYNSPYALGELSGFRNTDIIRTTQGTDNEYAASLVNYANGWYLPSVGQLRKLYSALPFIESALTAAGGTTLSDGTYWSSTEFSTSDASTPVFALGNTNKTSTCRVRAIRNFVTAGNNVVVVASNDNNMGLAMVSGNGTFTYGASVTVTAYPNEGYSFDHWSEDGVAVSFDASYQFTFARSRSLVAHFLATSSVGSIVNNADGSRGVVFWLSPNGDEGLMVALEDASEGCQWGEAVDALTLLNKPYNSPMALRDVSGNTNTRCIRKHQGVDNEYAASLVDFANGWYLPSAGELRKLYAALPIIEPALVNAGGSTLTEDAYWTSTEYSGSDAATATFSMGNTNKTNTCRVRAIRHFAAAGPNAITVKSNNFNFGTVAGSGEYIYGQNVTVTALPNPGYAFNTWTENGMIVSYDATYQFPFTRSRSLVANFVALGSVGSIVTNADGFKGVVFYTFPSGIGGLMVALEDASEGCPWGLNEDITIMDNQSPDAVMDLLNEMSGKSNTNKIREWYSANPDYAAYKTDFAHGWYLPSAGQLRKLYSALPVIEEAIINAGGIMLTEDAYWSSTEQSADNAWTPSFAMGPSNKTGNCRVRAIRSVLGTEFIVANVNNVAGGTVTGDGEYDVGQTCTMTATPAEGYTFINWTDNRSVVSTLPTIQFVVDASRILTANFLPTDSISTQTVELAQGWNWFSTNVEITSDDLKAALVTALPSTSISIKSRTQNTTYNPNTHRWNGNLTWDVANMYRIYVGTACEITLTGTPINPAEHPVTIQNGVNWIAFPLSESMSVTNAFAGFAVDGDQVKSRYGNTQYRNNRWMGQLNTLEPGKGYIYISNTQGTRIFTFPTNTR